MSSKVDTRRANVVWLLRVHKRHRVLPLIFNQFLRLRRLFHSRARFLLYLCSDRPSKGVLAELERNRSLIAHHWTCDIPLRSREGGERFAEGLAHWTGYLVNTGLLPPPPLYVYFSDDDRIIELSRETEVFEQLLDARVPSVFYLKSIFLADPEGLEYWKEPIHAAPVLFSVHNHRSFIYDPDICLEAPQRLVDLAHTCRSTRHSPARLIDYSLCTPAMARETYRQAIEGGKCDLYSRALARVAEGRAAKAPLSNCRVPRLPPSRPSRSRASGRL